LRSRPLIERRELLAKPLEKAPQNIKFSEELQGSKEELLRVARQFQLEGLTAKRPDSLYEPGRRSGAWVKIKLTQQQEFVIGGYTPPEGGRKYFGALLVGYYGPPGARKQSKRTESEVRASTKKTPPFAMITVEISKNSGSKHLVMKTFRASASCKSAKDRARLLN
jgi:ATP-dependent DNA ligase